MKQGVERAPPPARNFARYLKTRETTANIHFTSPHTTSGRYPHAHDDSYDLNPRAVVLEATAALANADANANTN